MNNTQRVYVMVEKTWKMQNNYTTRPEAVNAFRDDKLFDKIRKGRDDFWYGAVRR